MPTVVNRHHYRGKRLPQPWMYIGRGTPLGNPFRYPEHPDALEQYRSWLWWRIRERDDGVLRMLAQIRPETHLVCSCAPRPCHGDIVVRAWEWWHRATPDSLAAEPPYPGCSTVLVTLSDPELTAHTVATECSREEPHPTSECGLWSEPTP